MYTFRRLIRDFGLVVIGFGAGTAFTVSQLHSVTVPSVELGHHLPHWNAHDRPITLIRSA